ncbi:MAG: hypothetical protein NTX03_06465 [Bacteroidetes bacterium]|nr:hypothetical protein [Bacteroidota bacterium]
MFFCFCMLMIMAQLTAIAQDVETKKFNFKDYLLGEKDNRVFATELNLHYGYIYSPLQYKSFNDFLDLYMTLNKKDNINIPSFSPVWHSTYGVSFRIAALGAEIGTTELNYHTQADKYFIDTAGNPIGRREFDLGLSENYMAIFIGMRKRYYGYGVSVGGVFGTATLKPTFRDYTTQKSNPGGTAPYLIGTFTGRYRYVTIGPEFYVGLGRLKVAFRFDYSLPAFRSIQFPSGTAIRDEDDNSGANYGPYIPRTMEAYKSIDAYRGAGDGRMYVGTDIQSNRFSLRLIYSIGYWAMPRSNGQPKKLFY